MCKLSNYAQTTLSTADAWTISGLTETESNAIVADELHHTKLNVVTHLDLYNIQDDVSTKYVLVHFLSVEEKC